MDLVDVYSAVATRGEVRAFTDKPVPRDALERILPGASRTPSGGNVQPWNTYVLTGASLAGLKKRSAKHVAAGDPGDEREFEMYPPNLKSPYRERQCAAAEPRYTALGIPREDKQARREAVAANRDCFGASAVLFCYIDRDMGSAQWADIGMYLQTIMLLLRAEGLHSCPRMAWSVYRRTVAEIVSPPDELMLFCGMSIGFEDSSTNHVRTTAHPFPRRSRFLTSADGGQKGRNPLTGGGRLNCVVGLGSIQSKTDSRMMPL